MLFPAKVNALLRRLADEPGVDHIDNFALARASDLPADWGRVVVSEPSAELEFRPPEFVFGQPEDPSCLTDVRDVANLVVPAKTIRNFKDVRIAGWRSMLTRDGFYSTASVYRDSDGDLNSLSDSSHDGLVVFDGSLIYAAGHDDRLRIVGNTLFLSALEPTNYGSFVFRMLPKLLYFLEQGIGVDQIVVPWKTTSIHAPIYVLPSKRLSSTRWPHTEAPPKDPVKYTPV